MRDPWDDLLACWRERRTAALATVTSVRGSAPREVGSAMLVRDDGTVVGSVSGGCVEGAVYELGREAIATGRPVREQYGIADEAGIAIGLTCGGEIEVFVEPVSPAAFPELEAVAALVDAQRPVAIATVVEHPDVAVVGRRLLVGVDDQPSEASLGSARRDAAVRADAAGVLASGRSATLTYGPDGERRGLGMRVLVQAFAPPPRLLVYGAVDHAAALASVGSFLGYDVTVCDARPVFATPERFPAAAEVVVDWPHRHLAAEQAAGRVDARTAVAVLTHDPKFDVPLLTVALRLPAIGFVGAMGSRRTHDDRLARLRAAGLDDAELARLSSPVGLDLGGRTPQETAVSIAAELVAAQWGGSGRPLRAVATPVHTPHA
ncbi:XdhC family protein [Nocardioides sp. TRM66260-LWL]|uniref:XdhC family protein n=1 Tax=Nocardioides sp. TRM66260-LWL TaxID=2874478 RepID=UPI001CC4C07F|nr:XdhC family protein [Nocardioides sp. TRM66260-LWL]MBZ5735102.1 XdhC family protein [Nocardioides sp. TRM66260-LWL]